MRGPKVLDLSEEKGAVLSSLNLSKTLLIAAAMCAITGCAGAATGPGPGDAASAGSARKGTLVTSPTPKPEPGLAARAQAPNNQFWWPERLDLSPLRQHAAESDPMGKDFKYAEAFKKLDLKALKKDIAQVLSVSQAWWPADYGNYGPFFIRMAWHSAAAPVDDAVRPGAVPCHADEERPVVAVVGWPPGL